jgi:hypothetical protein
VIGAKAAVGLTEAARLKDWRSRGAAGRGAVGALSVAALTAKTNSLGSDSCASCGFRSSPRAYAMRSLTQQFKN